MNATGGVRDTNREKGQPRTVYQLNTTLDAQKIIISGPLRVVVGRFDAVRCGTTLGCDWAQHICCVALEKYLSLPLCIFTHLENFTRILDLQSIQVCAVSCSPCHYLLNLLELKAACPIRLSNSSSWYGAH